MFDIFRNNNYEYARNRIGRERLDDLCNKIMDYFNNCEQYGLQSKDG